LVNRKPTTLEFAAQATTANRADGQRKAVVGLALGSGSARGWAHIGVIQALEEAGIHADIVCGTSIGGLVGAAYAAGELPRFGKWVTSLSLREVVSLMDPGLSGGMLKGAKVMEFFRKNFVDRPINELNLPFGVVATVLHTGAEIWLRAGSTVEAVRASIGMPGLFAPVRYDGRVLVDGGLVNPVPVSLARAMGAEIVIAIDLSSDLLTRRHVHSELVVPGTPPGRVSAWMRKLQDTFGAAGTETAPTESVLLPSMLTTVAQGLNIMQVRIARSRMAGEPPELVIAPRLAHVGLLEFHRGREAIEEGRHAVEVSLHGHDALGLRST
jgi:NTE family protein